ncbi:D-alanyl-D-alanine carboxypeptidase family protein [Marinivivus vitaminiproducens]|uniref:D-alanyl-D-alanine carboxypeptidase family protein n=1 Tax=Marinivivus vitaminiproducens TaxID=3035935 RepID=UPI0027A3F498|nr:D-alanyl-D-alanine carboxypeptidase [Geminicoccaceae bacterium SCSIO 64248]
MSARVLALACTLVLALASATAPSRPAQAQAFETPARAAILIDLSSNQVLFAKNPDDRLPPASMSKLMTALMVFERLKQGSLSLDDTLPVSEKAWRMGGSKMFVEVGNRVRVEDLLRGIIIQSGNDACIVVAEALGGSEAGFAEMMTAKGEAIGLTGSHFANASGWPDPEHYMTPRDLATVAQTIIAEYGEYYHFYAETAFEWNGIRQPNRNPLLRAGIEGVDGLKTGHTEEAGYGLVASAQRGDRRLLMVLNGLSSERERATEAERLIEYGFRMFDTYRLVEANTAIGEAPTWLAEAPAVPLVAQHDVVVSMPRAARPELKVDAIYDSPVPAPVAAGTELGHLSITAPGIEPIVVPLVAGADVARAGPFGRAAAVLGHLVWGPAS